MALLVSWGVAVVFARTHHWSLLMASTSLSLLVVGMLLQRRRQEKVEVSVSINEATVRLTAKRNEKLFGNPLVIPRRDILDVVVNEVILAHRVVTVLVFRVRKGSDDDKTYEDNVQILLSQDRVRLVPVFPAIELTFRECHTLRRNITTALEGRKTF